jgi:hypothetical protein
MGNLNREGTTPAPDAGAGEIAKALLLSRRKKRSLRPSRLRGENNSSA